MSALYAVEDDPTPEQRMADGMKFGHTRRCFDAKGYGICESECPVTRARMLAEPNRQRMTAIAARFPALAGAPLEPFDPFLLLRWAKAKTRSERLAAHFVISIWSGHGVGKGKFPGMKAFDIIDACAVWDADQRRAACAWIANPYFP